MTTHVKKIGQID